jgi:D-alanyl-D-alanine carboxypeptidase
MPARLPISMRLALAAGLALTALWAHAGPTGPLPPAVAQALQRAQVPESAASFLVLDLDGAQVRLSHRAAEPMNPASAIKLLTTSAALDLLGPAHTWTTTVVADGLLQGEVLKGHLVLRGGGDPKLVVEDLKEIAERLRAMGGTDSAGDVVRDAYLRGQYLPLRTQIVRAVFVLDDDQDYEQAGASSRSALEQRTELMEASARDGVVRELQDPWGNLSYCHIPLPTFSWTSYVEGEPPVLAAQVELRKVPFR